MAYGRSPQGRPLVFKFRIVANSLAGCRIQFEPTSPGVLAKLDRWLTTP